MAIITKEDLFNYSNIIFTAELGDISTQYWFIVNRLLTDLNALMIRKSAFIDIYNIDICPNSSIPTLHFVLQGNTSNRELDSYLDTWPKEFERLLN